MCTERHRTSHIGWLRAAVLGANDGLISTSSLVVGVADQLMTHDALGAHARDELGITEGSRARPIQAALASAASFAIGAAPPVLLTGLAPPGTLTRLVFGTTIVIRGLLAALAARLGRAPLAAGALRVAFWGAVAMAVTAGVGHLVGGVF